MGDTTTLPAPPVRHDERLDRRWRLTGLALVVVSERRGLATHAGG